MRCFAAVALAALIFAATATATIKPGRGMSGIVLGMTPAQVQAKFHRLSADAVPQAQRDAIVAEVTALERAPSIRTLMKLTGRHS